MIKKDKKTFAMSRCPYPKNIIYIGGWASIESIQKIYKCLNQLEKRVNELTKENEILKGKL